jgi:hypothetical protein
MQKLYIGKCKPACSSGVRRYRHIAAKAYPCGQLICKVERFSQMIALGSIPDSRRLPSDYAPGLTTLYRILVLLPFRVNDAGHLPSFDAPRAYSRCLYEHPRSLDPQLAPLRPIGTTADKIRLSYTTTLDATDPLATEC